MGGLMGGKMLLCIYITDVFFYFFCSSAQKKHSYCILLECNLNTFFSQFVVDYK